MRRSIVPPSLLLAAAAVAAIWILALAGSGAAVANPAHIHAASSPHIACPVSAGAQPPTCCPLPPGAAIRPHVQPVCCGTVATPCCANTTCCATCCPPAGSGTCCPAPCSPAGSVTITSSPNPSTAGQKVVISGAVTTNPAAGAQVVLWRKLVHQSSFQQVAQTTADSAGHYSFTLKKGTVTADQTWYASSGSVQSAAVQQQVTALVALATSTRSTSVGQTIVLRGHVTPSHAGDVVLVEMSSGGAWRVIARPRLGHGSSYAVSRRFAQPGSLRFRVVLQGDGRNERSTSRTVKVVVRQ